MSISPSWRWIWTLAVVHGLAGCADDDGAEPAAADAAVTDAAPAAHDEDAGAPTNSPDATSPHADAAVGEPALQITNLSFETATALSLPAAPLQFVILSGQSSYFSFEGRANTFYALTTERSVFSPDNTISVFDPEQKLLGQNDEGSLWSSDRIDARLLIRLERDGTHYIRIEQASLPAESLHQTYDPPLSYHIAVREIEAGSEGFGLELADETPSGIEFLRDPSDEYAYVTLLGDLTPGDSDVFEIHGQAEQALIGRLLRTTTAITNANGAAVVVSVLDQTQQHALARIERAQSQVNIHPPVADATYRVRVELSSSAPRHAAYALDLVMLDENPAEKAEAANNELAGAEALALTGPVSRRGRVLARLPADDVDYYAFEAKLGERLLVGCEAESAGSGVRGLKAELLDSAQKSLATASEESSAQTLLIEDVPVTQAGMHYLKLSSTAAAAAGVGADVIEPWVRCAVIAGP